MNRRTAALCAALLLGAIIRAQEPEPAAEAKRAVLVTGASSGIGRKTTELLAQNGFHVYAGARKQADLDELNAIAGVEAIWLDVTEQAHIDAAVATVRERGRGLYGLINNAGVLVLAPLIELREQDLAFQLDVNLYGAYRVTKAFAPLLIESKGRVLTTGSLSGTVSWAFGGPYCISKHAVEAFTDVLAAELRPFGVAVSVIEPGNYKTEIMTNMRERLVASGYTTEGSRYKDRLDGMLERPTDRSQYPEPDDVAAAYLEALTAEQPRRRYLVVPNRNEAMLTLRAAMQRVVQLNDGQAFELDRDALIEMLDEALANRR
jgi:NAD(P)-dependent dehydrogenase (short-subunit alcohol dehydrogenase family)